MAKIIFSTISGIPNSSKLPCFYEGMINALVREGNEVLVMITNNFIKNPWNSNKISSKINKDKLEKELKNFNPDIIITCNNSLYNAIPEMFSCPIIIYGTDSPALFIEREELKKNIARYNIMVASEDFIPMARQYFGNDMRSLDLLHFATDFVSEKIEQDKNISFIGTNFNFAFIPFKNLLVKNPSEEDRQKMMIFLDHFKKDVLEKPESYLKKLGWENSFIKDFFHIDLLNLLSSNFRIQVLQEINDLGLSLYGGKTWYDVAGYSLDLALCYRSQEISSVKENQDVYNSSKISINISHSQAGRAFSWRVRDIMACNSVLISDPREDLITQFGKYVKIPTYENHYEARQICQKLLRDEVWRSELITASNQAIEEGHRFHHRLKDIGQIMGIDLFMKQKGKIIDLNSPENLKKVSYFNIKELVFSKNGFPRKANRVRNKSFRKIKNQITKIIS